MSGCAVETNEVRLPKADGCGGRAKSTEEGRSATGQASSHGSLHLDQAKLGLKWQQGRLVCQILGTWEAVGQSQPSRNIVIPWDPPGTVWDTSPEQEKNLNSILLTDPKVDRNIHMSVLNLGPPQPCPRFSHLN